MAGINTTYLNFYSRYEISVSCMGKYSKISAPKVVYRPHPLHGEFHYGYACPSGFVDGHRFGIEATSFSGRWKNRGISAERDDDGRLCRRCVGRGGPDVIFFSVFRTRLVMCVCVSVSSR